MKSRIYRSEEDLRTVAADIARNVTVRTYDNGSSCDVTRRATVMEESHLFTIALGALDALNWDRQVTRMHNMSEYCDGVLSMAEFTVINLFGTGAGDEAPHVNSYDTIYLPLKRAIREWPLDLPEEE